LCVGSGGEWFRPMPWLLYLQLRTASAHLTTGCVGARNGSDVPWRVQLTKLFIMQFSLLSPYVLFTILLSNFMNFFPSPSWGSRFYTCTKLQGFNCIFFYLYNFREGMKILIFTRKFNYTVNFSIFMNSISVGCCCSQIIFWHRLTYLLYLEQ
jgi:hypothetical protein